jgi:hypothetical protein
MANSANVRDELRISVVIDSDATLATGAAATVLCNREYDVVDYYFNITVVAAGGNDQFLIDSAATTTGAGVSQGAVVATAAPASLRPSTVTAGGTSNWLAAAATVTRGSYLRVLATAGSAAARGSGTITIMPGNRYAAGNGTYYPNNSAALQS